MAYQEKKSFVTFASYILTFIFYYLYLANTYPTDMFESTTNYSFWAESIFWLILLNIIVVIAVTIVFSIINTVITNEKLPDFEDELDKLIDLKASRNGSMIFYLGFFLALGSVVMEYELIVMFKIFFYMIFGIGIMMESSVLYFRRRGIS